jgi:hypothetical protein
MRQLPPPPPGYLCLFPKAKRVSNSFQSINEVKLKMADLLKIVLADDLQHCFEQWEICIERMS